MNLPSVVAPVGLIVVTWSAYRLINSTSFRSSPYFSVDGNPREPCLSQTSRPLQNQFHGDVPPISLLAAAESDRPGTCDVMSLPSSDKVTSGIESDWKDDYFFFTITFQ